MKKIYIFFISILVLFCACDRTNNININEITNENNEITNENILDEYQYIYYNCTDEEFGIASDGTLVIYNGKEDVDVYIPDNVRNINNCFGGKNVKDVFIPASVKYIYNIPFCKNYKISENNPYYYDINGVLFDKSKSTLIHFPSLKEVNSYKIPDNVLKVEQFAFNNSKIRIIDLNSCVTIESHGFASTNIEKIDFKNNLKSIGSYAFMNCDNIKHFDLPNGVVNIGERAFGLCENLEIIKVSDSVKNIGECLVNGSIKLKELYIPNSVKLINGKLFDKIEYPEMNPVIFVEKGSCAEKYAKENGYQYKYYDFEKNQVIN